MWGSDEIFDKGVLVFGRGSLSGSFKYMRLFHLGRGEVRLIFFQGSPCFWVFLPGGGGSGEGVGVGFG